jgi:hypothetical protein
MLPLAEAEPPLDFPAWLHLILWPVMVVWVCALVRRRRRRSRRASLRLGLTLFPAALLVESVTLAASHDWPVSASSSLVFGLLWLAWMISLAGFLLLRTPDDGDDSDTEEDPEPPWWPEFERQLNDYTRNRPRAPAGNPKVPVAAP